MKKFIYLSIIAVTIIIMFIGCGKNEETNNQEITQKPNATEEPNHTAGATNKPKGTTDINDNKVTKEHDNSQNTNMEQDEIKQKAFKEIDFGRDHIVALKQNGEVIAWGDNSKGQCNVPKNIKKIVSISTGFYHSLAIQSDGSVIAWGDNSKGQCNVPKNINNVKDIAVGIFHSVALLENGSVVMWGDNEYNQQDIPKGLSNVTKIVAAGTHTSALKQNGEIITWGDDSDGEDLYYVYDTPENIGKCIDISTFGTHIIALQSDNTLVGWGRAYGGETNIPEGLKDVSSISTGFGVSIALKNDGKFTVIDPTRRKNYYYYEDIFENATYVAAGWYVVGIILENGQLVILGEDVCRFYNKELDNVTLFEIYNPPVPY